MNTNTGVSPHILQNRTALTLIAAPHHKRNVDGDGGDGEEE